MHIYHYRPTDILSNRSHTSPNTNRPDGATISRNSLIILNQPLRDVQLLKEIWKSCEFKVCADGGSNRLFDCLRRAGLNVDEYLPDAIVGDLDSIRPDVLEYYETEKFVPIERDNDLYSTDFAKSMRHVLKCLDKKTLLTEATSTHYSSDASKDNIIIMSSLGGRVDQGIGLLHELYRETQSQEVKNRGINLWLITESSISFILSPGLTIIEEVSPSRGVFTENAGILPTYGAAVITIRGFEWDVEGWPTEMGGQVSTSNHIKKDKVEVETDKPVLFTVEFAEGSR